MHNFKPLSLISPIGLCSETLRALEELEKDDLHRKYFPKGIWNLHPINIVDKCIAPAHVGYSI